MQETYKQSGRQGSWPRDAGSSTLEKLDHALSLLEQRIGIQPENKPRRATEKTDDISAILQRQQAISRRAGEAYRRAEAGRRLAATTQARESVGIADIRAEMTRLRKELNHEMSSDIAQQFGQLRQELKTLSNQASRISPTDLSDGFDRITRELGLVASRVEHNDMGSLRGEVEELKQHVAALAREDTLREMSERWGSIEREITSLPQTLGSRGDLKEAVDRIEEINTAISGLPDSEIVGQMQQQIHHLASTVEQLAARATITPDHLAAVYNRLDEIGEAVVGATREFDSAPFERIEDRIAALSSQMEQQAAAPGDAMELQFEEIRSRLDLLRENQPGALRADAFDAVNHRLDAIASRLDEGRNAPGADARFSEDLEARLGEIAQRLEAQNSASEERGERMFQSLDSRLESLAQRIEESQQGVDEVPGLDHIERRIEEIAQMLTSGDVFGPPAPAAPIDDSVLKSLEGQIATLSERLGEAKGLTATVDLEELLPRLSAVADTMSRGEDDIFAAAREAAEQVIRQLPQGDAHPDHETLSLLTQDLKGLEELARDSDTRNGRTFEAIHDSLVKVADRIASLESSLVGQASWDEPEPRGGDDLDPDEEEALREHIRSGAPKYEIEDAPSVDYAADADDLPVDDEREEAFSPADAAAMAMQAEEQQVSRHPAPAQEKEANRKGLLSGLKSVLPGGTKTATAGAATAEPQLYEESDTYPEVDVSDEPLEPGTGGPDLAAIMHRVRAERGDRTPVAGTRAATDDDAGKSDFIAAARRAARAAADEASTLEPGKGRKREGKKASKGLAAAVASRKRPLLIGAGAILLALMALPLVRGYLPAGIPGSTKVVIQEPAPVEPAAEEEVDPITLEDEGALGTAEPGVDVDLTTDTVTSVDETVSATVVSPYPDSADTAMQAVPQALRMPDQAVDTDAATAAIPHVAAESDMPADEETAPLEAPAGYNPISIDDVPESIGPAELRQAAVDGDPKALFLIGDRLMGAGPGAPGSDLEGAARWYERAAELGFAPAQYRLGNFYEKGLGVDRDVQQAMTWYQLAAEQGNASAMHNLAVLHATEVNGTRNVEAAGRWFRKAAELGVKDSQVNLGILSARGEGVQQDLAESYKWLALAARSGDTDAQTKRDEVAGYLQPDQLEAARRAVDLWEPEALEAESNKIQIPETWNVSGETTASVPMSDDQLAQAVRNIQTILGNAGYDAGPADGIMGERTRDAIIAFQKDNDMVPNGEVNRILVDKLLEINEQS